MTTRWPSGINNADAYSALSNMPQPDPSKMQSIWDDFNFLDAAAWTVVETQAGATQAGTAGAGGLILFTNSAAIADINAFTTPLAGFRLVAGKRFFAKCRCTVSDVTNVNVTFGLGNVATLLTPANGIYATKVGTAVSVTNANTSVLTAASYTDTSGLAAATFFTMGIEYDGKSLNLYYGIGSTLAERKVASIDAPNLNTGVDLLFFWGMKNVNAVANTATLDYLQAAMER